ncbi:MAG: Gfo/Idh/MocA family protein [Alphaproteobacteria bacterium]
MRELRVAVAGFGGAARCHIEALAEIPGFTVTAVYTPRPDIDQEQIRALLGDRVEIFPTFDDLVERADCDVVSICTMHDVHAEQAIKAARAGKHIALEKPVCVDPANLLSVRREIKAAGVKVCVCFQEFHYGQFKTALELLDDGFLGRVHLAEVDYYHGLGPEVSQHWWIKSRATGGSSLLAAGCHGLMFLLLAMGETPVAEVTALSTRSSSPLFEAFEYDGTLVALVRFADGRIGRFSSVVDSVQPYTFRFALLGSDGTLMDRRLNSRKYAGFDPAQWTELGTRDIADGGDIGGYMYVNMFRKFYDHIVHDAALPYTNFDTVFEMHRVLFAAETSAAEGRTVRLDGFLEV